MGGRIQGDCRGAGLAEGVLGLFLVSVFLISIVSFFGDNLRMIWAGSAGVLAGDGGVLATRPAPSAKPRWPSLADRLAGGSTRFLFFDGLFGPSRQDVATAGDRQIIDQAVHLLAATPTGKRYVDFIAERGVRIVVVARLGSGALAEYDDGQLSISRQAMSEFPDPIDQAAFIGHELFHGHYANHPGEWLAELASRHPELAQQIRRGEIAISGERMDNSLDEEYLAHTMQAKMFAEMLQTQCTRQQTDKGQCPKGGRFNQALLAHVRLGEAHLKQILTDPNGGSAVYARLQEYPGQKAGRRGGSAFLWE